ncbi:MAG: PilZ domain-containing protein [Isosphaerales bacterium]
MTLAIERRASFRSETVNKQTIVQFMDWTARQITGSKLVNISETGALILTDKLPALYQPLWVRVENAPAAGWIAAETIRFGSPEEVGIRFYRPCPWNFLMGATFRRSIPNVADDQKVPPFVDEGKSEDTAPRENP